MSVAATVILIVYAVLGPYPAYVRVFLGLAALGAALGAAVGIARVWEALTGRDIVNPS